MDELRWELRQRESRPIFKGIRQWLAGRDALKLPQSPLREGINCFRNRWDAFTLFLEHNVTRLDNNSTEAALRRPVVVLAHGSSGIEGAYSVRDFFDDKSSVSLREKSLGEVRGANERLGRPHDADENIAGGQAHAASSIRR